MSGSKSLTVQGLLSYLRALIDKRAPIVDVIRRPLALLQGLEELDALVEMHEVKYALVQQIQLLLITAYSGRKGLTGHKLHTVFYGPPGVGKSKAARAMARIWYGIGVSPEQVVSAPTPPPPEAVAVDAVNIINNLVNIKTVTTPLRTDNAAWVKFDELLMTAYTDSHHILTLIQPDLSEPSPQLPLPDEKGVHHDTETVVKNEDLPLCIAGREDLVGEYMGHTAMKTLAFLKANRGKVIIIEEAYLLYTGEKDHFGMEALTLLNRFMDEHADETIIVFTGYKDLMLSTIFSAQPGLRRRCQWVFEVKGYTPAGLAEIFTSQVLAMGWTVSPKINLTTFFTNNAAAFPAYGGDTERLAFHVKLAHSELVFATLVGVFVSGVPDLTAPCLTPAILTAAFGAYRGNLITVECEAALPPSMYT